MAQIVPTGKGRSSPDMGHLGVLAGGHSPHNYTRQLPAPKDRAGIWMCSGITTGYTCPGLAAPPKYMQASAFGRDGDAQRDTSLSFTNAGLSGYTRVPPVRRPHGDSWGVNEVVGFPGQRLLPSLPVLARLGGTGTSKRTPPRAPTPLLPRLHPMTRVPMIGSCAGIRTPNLCPSRSAATPQSEWDRDAHRDTPPDTNTSGSVTTPKPPRRDEGNG